MQESCSEKLSRIVAQIDAEAIWLGRFTIDQTVFWIFLVSKKHSISSLGNAGDDGDDDGSLNNWWNFSCQVVVVVVVVVVVNKANEENSFLREYTRHIFYTFWLAAQKFQPFRVLKKLAYN